MTLRAAGSTCRRPCYRACRRICTPLPPFGLEVVPGVGADTVPDDDVARNVRPGEHDPRLIVPGITCRRRPPDRAQAVSNANRSPSSPQPLPFTPM